jgi:hypothetical protein
MAILWLKLCVHVLLLIFWIDKGMKTNSILSILVPNIECNLIGPNLQQLRWHVNLMIIENILIFNCNSIDFVVCNFTTSVINPHLLGRQR